MSTFGALLYFDGRPVARTDIERMSQALVVSRNYEPRIKLNGAVAMAHQLNPFTPEDLFERQPYTDPTGRYWLLADARLDNRDELLKEFGIAAATASSVADGRLVMEAFCRWGHESPQKLQGDFAFLVWDCLEKSLFCACDPMGARTLLFYWKPPFLAVSTLLRGLHALPQIPRTADRTALIDYLALRPLAIGHTLFEGIERVPAGYTFFATAGRRRLKRYWFLEGRKEIRLPNDEAYREAFMELFTKAVHSRLRAIGPVGISMSGGLDSASVGALAATELAKKNQKLTAFTLVHRRSFDPNIRTERIDPEYAFVEAMKARYANLEAVYLTGKDQRLLDELDADFEAAGIMPHSVLFQRRHRTLFPEVQSRGIRVLLNGYNGNTTLSYSGVDSIFPLFVKGRWLSAFEGIRALQPLHRSSFRQLFFRLLFRPFYPRTLDLLINDFFPDKRAHVCQTYGIKPEYYYGAKGPVSKDALGYFKNIMMRMNPNFARERMFIDGIQNNIADLWPATRASWQIDERDPASDLRLVEFCLSIPMEQFLRKGANRFLLRNAMKPYLPEQILNRASFGLREPDLVERVDEVREDMHLRFQRIKAADRLDFLDYEQLQTMLDAPTKQGCDAARYAMRAITMGEFAAWLAGSND
jgi:asparagine synthase (glutamine-hydrolysing)